MVLVRVIIPLIALALTSQASAADLNRARLGGIGAGWLELRSDGTLGESRLAAFGVHPSAPQPGSFAALWTEAGGEHQAAVLGSSSAFGLPCLASESGQARFPYVEVTYPDKGLPVKVSLRAFSPLVLHDTASSVMPAAVLVYRISNVSGGPANAAIALSWQPALGMRAVDEEKPDRSGMTGSRIPPSGESVGVRLDGPPVRDEPSRDLRVLNLRGSAALLAEYSTRRMSASTASWNVLTGSPAWWEGFASSGEVSGEAGPAVEGSVHLAGCAAVRLALKPKETREIIFVMAWHTPRLYDERGQAWRPAYVSRFKDAEAVARHVLQDAGLLDTLTEEWQRAIVRSAMGAPLLAALCEELEDFVSRSFLAAPETDASRSVQVFRLLQNDLEGTEAVDGRTRRRLQPCLLATYPDLDRFDLLSRITSAVMQALSEEECAALVQMVARHVEWGGTGEWVREAWPDLRRIGECLLKSERIDGDAVGALLDLASMCNDAVVSERCVGVLRQAASAPSPVSRSAWQEWREKLGCSLDAQTATLAVAPEALAIDGVLRGPVFAPRYMATLTVRFTNGRMEVEFRLDRLYTPKLSIEELLNYSPNNAGARIAHLVLPLAKGLDAPRVDVAVGRSPVGIASTSIEGNRVHIALETPVVLRPGDRLVATISRGGAPANRN